MSDPKTAAAQDAMSIGLQRQMQVYQGALTGARLSIPVPLPLLEKKAAEVMDAAAFDYVAGGASGERTMRANLDAFSRWDIVPRMLCDVSHRDLSIELFGSPLPAPVLLAPIGVQGIVRAEGELASGRAAASLNVPFVLSTLSSHCIEDVACSMGSSPRWFQLYWGKDSEITSSMLARAERAGYSALVVTLDTQLLGWRPRDLQYPYLPFLQGQGLSNYFSDPVFRSRLAAPPEADPAAAILLWTKIYSNTALTWKDLGWLRSQTRLPILLKGILHPDDAQRALDAGMDGVMVSNHGGRQVDGAIAALDALPEVVHAVQGKVPVLFDSGIRHGSDALKALALGAKAVLLGRPYIWGLAVAGEVGVRDVTLNLLADLDITMGLCGCASVGALDDSWLQKFRAKF